MSRRSCLKVNADKKSNIMLLNREEGLEYEVRMDGIQLEHVTEFIYLVCVLDEPGTYYAACLGSAASERKVILPKSSNE